MNRFLSMILSLFLLIMVIVAGKAGLPYWVTVSYLVIFVFHGLIKKAE